MAGDLQISDLQWKRQNCCMAGRLGASILTFNGDTFIFFKSLEYASLDAWKYVCVISVMSGIKYTHWACSGDLVPLKDRKAREQR